MWPLQDGGQCLDGGLGGACVSDPVELNKVRAEKAGDSRLWTPLDALRDLVARIEAGEISPEKLAVNYVDAGGDRRWVLAGLTRTEYIALLSVALHRAVADA